MRIKSKEINPCFECGNPTDLRHHVVPVSKGGKNTIPLCARCHRKAHGDSGERKYSPELIKDGLAKAVALGVKLGAPVKQHEPLLPYRNKGYSYREIARITGLSLGTVHKHIQQEIQDLMPFNKDVF